MRACLRIVVILTTILALMSMSALGWNPIKKAARWVEEKVVNEVKKVPKKVKNTANKAKQWVDKKIIKEIKKVPKKVKKAVHKAKKWVDKKVVNEIKKVPKKVKKATNKAKKWVDEKVVKEAKKAVDKAKQWVDKKVGSEIAKLGDKIAREAKNLGKHLKKYEDETRSLLLKAIPGLNAARAAAIAIAVIEAAPHVEVVLANIKNVKAAVSDVHRISRSVRDGSLSQHLSNVKVSVSLLCKPFLHGPKAELISLKNTIRKVHDPVVRTIDETNDTLLQIQSGSATVDAAGSFDIKRAGDAVIKQVKHRLEKELESYVLEAIQSITIRAVASAIL